ncbi:MAG: DUF935 domain-containing protein [Candidatus Magnetominusculus sp. LBB02]|nr:DUF935 domain-containing protein [Candidatus Magnetominusculus sp. LBB02]
MALVDRFGKPIKGGRPVTDEIAVATVRDRYSTYPSQGLTQASPMWGEELIANKFVVHRYRSRSGITPRAGLLRPCSYAYIFKNYNIKDWLIFNELFSTPMRMGKYQPGASKDEIAVLKQAVFNMGIDAAAVISSSTTIELLESKLRADPKSFSEFLDVFDKAISKAVLGHAGSSDSTPGKLGADDQAHEVRRDLLSSDAKALAGTIRNQIIGPWVLFNYGPNAAAPLFKFHHEENESLDATAKVYSTLVAMGFLDIGIKHIHERFGIPVPEAGEDTLKTYASGGTDSMASISNNANTLSVNKAALPADTTAHPVDAFLEQLQEQSNQAMSGLFDPINKLTNDVSSLDELRDKILDTYKDMDAAALGGLIERAMTAVELAGRYEVKSGKRPV